MKPPGERGAADGGTGLPGLRSWRAVYWFVAATFVLWAGLLTLLTRMFP
jgi:hypothetical protein